MIREYERALNSSEKQTIESLMIRNKSESFKTKISLVILIITVMFSWLLLWVTEFNYLPVTLIIIIASLLISYQVYSEILELIELPKNLIKSKEIVENGTARVTEIHIDRYLEIRNNEDRLDYFLIEHKGNLKLIEPANILGANRLNSLTEKIDVLGINKDNVFHTEMNYSGNNLEPYLVVKNEDSKEIFESNLWKSLINDETVIGALEDFEVIIRKTKANTLEG